MNDYLQGLLATIVVASILSPLYFLRPNAKRIYLPIALSLIAFGLQVMLFLLLGHGPIFYILFCWGIICLLFVINSMRVCPDCGRVVGLYQGSSEVHKCTRKSTCHIQNQLKYSEVQEADFSQKMSECTEEVNFHFDSESSTLHVLDGREKMKRLFGLCFSLFFMGAAIYSIKHDNQNMGPILALMSVGIILLIHSSETEINVRSRTIIRMHLWFRKFVIWRRTCTIEEGDYVEIRIHPLQDSKYDHNLVIVRDGQVQITIGKFTYDAGVLNPALVQFAKVVAGVLQIKYWEN